MVHTDHDPVDPSVLAEMGYEKRDVNLRPLIWGAFWLFAGTIIVGFMGAGFIKLWGLVPEVETKQQPFHEVRPPAGTPILQNNSDNTADIVELRKREAEQLMSSGPVKGEPGVYHISLDSAIKLISERGLPQTGTVTVSHPKPGEAGQVPAAPPPVALKPQASKPAAPPSGAPVQGMGTPHSFARMPGAAPSSPTPSTGAKP